MFVIQIINDIEPLTSTLYGVNACFIHHPSKSKITRSAISRKLLNPKKNAQLSYIFLHLSAIFGVKIQIMSTTEMAELFKSGKLTLNGSANGPVVTYSKIQNRFSRGP